LRNGSLFRHSRENSLMDQFSQMITSSAVHCRGSETNRGYVLFRVTPSGPTYLWWFCKIVLLFPTRQTRRITLLSASCLYRASAEASVSEHLQAAMEGKKVKQILEISQNSLGNGSVAGNAS
jgi:hypothetical protein